MHSDADNIQFSNEQLSNIKNILQNKGYIRLQFSADDLENDNTNLETNVVGIITRFGGQCVPHNKDPNSFVWHVRPANTADTTTRSNTNDEIPWHTDCAFEIDPPEYQALFVVEPDNLGGGQLQIVRVNDVIQFLSAESIKALMTEKFKFKIKREYQKFDDIDYLEAPILFGNNEIRYRSDIDSPFHSALNDLNLAISQSPIFIPCLEKYTMIIANNRKFLHRRTKIVDPQRHLLRIRFNFTS